jgi:hypothetical protein
VRWLPPSAVHSGREQSRPWPPQRLSHLPVLGPRTSGRGPATRAGDVTSSSADVAVTVSANATPPLKMVQLHFRIDMSFSPVLEAALDQALGRQQSFLAGSARRPSLPSQARLNLPGRQQSANVSRRLDAWRDRVGAWRPRPGNHGPRRS